MGGESQAPAPGGGTTSTTATLASTTPPEPKKPEDVGNPANKPPEQDGDGVGQEKKDVSDKDDNNPSDGSAQGGITKAEKDLLWQYIVKPHYDKHRNDNPRNPLAEDKDNVVEKGFRVALDVGSLTSSVLAVANSGYAIDKDLDEKDETGNEITSGSNTVASMVGSFRSMMGLMDMGMGLGSLYDGYKRKNKNEKRQAGFKAFSGFTSAAAGALSAAAGFAGLDKADAGTIKGLALASSTIGALGSIGNIIGGYSNANQRSRMASAGSSFRIGKDQFDADMTAAGNGKDDASRNARRLAKAKAFSMSQAADMNSLKAQQEKSKAHRDLFYNGLGTLCSLAGSYGSAFTDLKTSGLVGGILGTAAMTLKYIGKGRELYKSGKNKKALQGKKDQVIRDYLDNKRPKIKADISADPHTSGIQVSDNVADRIAVARLGINLDITDPSGLSEDERKELFNRITLRRAKYLTQLTGPEKTQMMTALELDVNASVDQVAEVLGYEN